MVPVIQGRTEQWDARRLWQAFAATVHVDTKGYFAGRRTPEGWEPPQGARVRVVQYQTPGRLTMTVTASDWSWPHLHGLPQLEGPFVWHRLDEGVHLGISAWDPTAGGVPRVCLCEGPGRALWTGAQLVLALIGLCRPGGPEGVPSRVWPAGRARAGRPPAPREPVDRLNGSDAAPRPAAPPEDLNLLLLQLMDETTASSASDDPRKPLTDPSAAPSYTPSSSPEVRKGLLLPPVNGRGR